MCVYIHTNICIGIYVVYIAFSKDCKYIYLINVYNLIKVCI